MSVVEHVASCPSTCSVEVTVTFGQANPELVSELEATLAKGTDSVVVRTVNGVAKFENVRCDDEYTVTVKLPDLQRARCAGVPVLTKTQRVTRNDGKFIFTLASRPSLTVILYGDPDRTQKLTGIRVKAKPAGDSLSRDTGEDGGAAFGYLEEGDYDLSLELTDTQRRCFKPFAQTVALANDQDAVVEWVLDPVAVLKVAVARQDGMALAGNVEIEVRTELNQEGVQATLDSEVAAHTFPDLDPGEYFIGVAAQDEAEKKFRIGRTITRADANLQAVAEDNGRAEKVSVPGGHETTVSFVLAPPYKKVQFIGYYIYTGGVYRGTDDPWNFDFSFEKAAEADIQSRCTIMRHAITQAKNNAQIDGDPETLKLFMAPELYFRGRNGGYPIETIGGVGDAPGIVEQLQAVTLLDGYKDWLFVFGTAVGYREFLEQYLITSPTAGDTEISIKCSRDVDTDLAWSLVVTPLNGAPRTVNPTEVRHQKKLAGGMQEVILTVDDFPLPEGATLSLSTGSGDEAVVAPAEFIGKWVVLSFTCKKAPVANWEIRQGDVVGSIDSIQDGQGDEHACIVRIPSGGSFDGTQSATLAKPGAYDENEWFNIALIQKGGPAVPVTASGGKAIKEALVYKEYRSPIDFQDTRVATGQDTVLLHGGNVKPVPTEGAQGSKFPNAPDASSEVNKSGLGGGSVLTIDDVDFGIEVCRDHANGRLFGWYQQFAAEGDPRIQVHLIPSAGTTIRNRPCIQNGWIFNVDNMHCVLEKKDGRPQNSPDMPAACTALGNPGLDVSAYFNGDGLLIDPGNPTAFIDCNNGYIVVYVPGDLPARETV